ncbi:MAG: ATP-binding protein [Candidatus Aegiribacteria sp.]|nr:ATP-binding protein [Candidatus Aegiribacteria sp.]
MYRKAIERLKSWKTSEISKPLIIRGARQTGKTWLMKEFGNSCYERCAYINFENNSRMKLLFEGDFDIERLLLGLQVEAECPIVPGETLILFDEVQEVPKALTSLKYFQENAVQHSIIAAGSILGVALHPDTSFPVGKVEFLNLYPLSFPEFLQATGNTPLHDMIEKLDFSMVSVFAVKLKELLRQYYLVGGMPEVVNGFLWKRDFTVVRDIQKQLLDAYEQDFSKHAPNTTVPRIRSVWKSLPAQLARENRKFVYGLVRKGARAREYELAIQWLSDCGLVHIVNRITKPGISLQAYRDSAAFKLYAPDVGLLCAMSDLDTRSVLQGNRLFEEFKGALTEQFVLQQLISNAGINPFYWSADRSKGEVDFVLQIAGMVLPLEVKSYENLQAKSLKSYCNIYSPRIAFRTSLSGYREEEWLINLPLYTLHTIAELANRLFSGRRMEQE